MHLVGRWAALFLAGLLLGACATATQLSRRDAPLIQNRTYVIVGASSGFGRGTAVRLGALRANVVLAARRAELLAEVAREVEAAGGRALVVPTDVSDPAQVNRLAAAAVTRFGRVDVWMNIAGAGAVGRFWEIPIEDQSRVIDVNVKGVINGSQAALRQFVRQGGGTLVNMGSVESEVPIAYHATYAASKAAVLSLGRALNEELRHAGYSQTIKVSTVMPWAADTPFFIHNANYTGHKARMIMLDDPRKVVDALVWVSLHPREELPVGWKAQASVTAHNLLPDLTERVAADIHRSELSKGAAQPNSTGSLYQPMRDGRGVDGGIRERRRLEDAARKARRPR
ncbi:SDR family NAD(P)-dependent oxidoreductase [Sphingomonas sp. BN140010]|uniref:SDR family NAD(P)-dependent oxidoreductase n=1 Tax=Sphingomonas arvum TaxID=2992113 RepID=A0ABT3JDW4_9SPHN|nr:SDR family NAD(P)-dependent oxidoreductase [Sphingomonas sp. BN140010]MCW3797280.1 SDR family NAD(P)-dependent oxidoreductase [Sphingomonas sp. BN140010]